MAKKGAPKCKCGSQAGLKGGVCTTCRQIKRREAAEREREKQRSEGTAR